MATTKVKFTSQSAWETQQQLNANFDDLDGRVDTLEAQIVNAGKVDDVKINGTSIVSSKEANFNTKSTYNSETNKIVTETDIADFATSTSVANTYVPQTRTINNKPLSTDISLSATDVGALSSGTTYVSSVNGNSGAITGIATESFVNSSINSVTAYYITKNAQGAQFATVAELNSTTTFYSGGAVRVPTRNDYCIVQSDENHSNSTTRYIYQNGWEFQYVVNETALTDAQIQALNSGITATKLSTITANAIAGKSASDTIATYGDIVKHDANDFAPASKASDNNFSNDYKGQVDANTNARHTHSNKTLLDTIANYNLSTNNYFRFTNEDPRWVSKEDGSFELTFSASKYLFTNISSVIVMNSSYEQVLCGIRYNDITQTSITIITGEKFNGYVKMYGTKSSS